MAAASASSYARGSTTPSRQALNCPLRPRNHYDLASRDDVPHHHRCVMNDQFVVGPPGASAHGRVHVRLSLYPDYSDFRRLVPRWDETTSSVTRTNAFSSAICTIAASARRSRAFRCTPTLDYGMDTLLCSGSPVGVEPATASLKVIGAHLIVSRSGLVNTYVPPLQMRTYPSSPAVARRGVVLAAVPDGLLGRHATQLMSLPRVHGNRWGL